VTGGGKRAPGRPADAKESADWRSGKGVPRPEPCAVVADDLRRLPDLHALLRSLDDAYAGGEQLRTRIDALPVLVARIERRARRRFSGRSGLTLAESLPAIGNLGLEAELLQLLEDLTVLKADLDASGKASGS